MAGIIKQICRFLSLVLVGVACGSGTLYVPGDGLDRQTWSQAGGGEQGRAYWEQGIEPPLRLLWQQKIEASPLDGMLFSEHLVLQQTTAPSLYVFDRYSGQFLGKRGGDNPVCAPPMLVGDLLVYGELGSKPKLRAFDRRVGKVSWNYPGTVCTSVAGRGDTLLVAMESGQLVALSAGDGAELWKQEIGGLLHTPPTVASGFVYIGNSAGDLVALDLAAGEERWRCALGGGVRTRPAAGGEHIYVGLVGGVIEAVRAASGRRVWRRDLGALLTAGMALTPDILVVGAVDHSIYGIERKSGEIRWQFATEGVVRSAPAAVGQTVYCGSADGHFYALDSTSGRLQWKYRLDGPALSPVALGERMVGIGTEEGMVYVFGRL